MRKDKDTSYVLNRAERFRIVLIGEGLLVGAVAGVIVLLYRLVLAYAGDWLQIILDYAKGSPVKMCLWFVILALLAVFVGLLVKWEPMISGSGIPQLEGEMSGKLNQRWQILLAGVLGFTMPELLGNGHNLIDALTHGELILSSVLFLFVAKFVFSAVCFGSGAPGGIFFPLLVLGAFLGGIFGMVGTSFFGMSPEYINNFVLLAMAGYFTAIVRAPITGIILIFEMTGSLSQMLSLTVVSIVAYVVASLLKSEPIYESLLWRLLKNQGIEEENENGQKVLSEHVIMHGSSLVHKAVAQVEWPKHCLLVAIKRGEKEIIPKGSTILSASDVIVTMNDERDFSYVHEKMEELCAEQFQGK